ncbi:MAG: queuosine precursor transporter [Treponema sp.]|jgi:uncharacterized integral membrane protein (TIGR00697 family)|nr:queuosine precursor transporter [Treponema sp.]
MTDKSPETFKHLATLTAVVVAVLVVSNVASSAKIISLGFSLFGIPMAFDGGTLLFPLAYVAGDVLTEVYGFRIARRVIWTGFFCLAFSTVIFFLLKILPGDAEWQGYAGDGAYGAILGGMSSGGIVVASLAGYLAGEFSNSFVLVRIKAAMRGRLLFVRTIGSTLVGELLDTLVFITIATLTGVFGWDSFASLVLTNYLCKCLIEALMTPVTYLAVGALRKAEAAA